MKILLTFSLLFFTSMLPKPLWANSPYDFQAVEQAILNVSSYANLLEGELFTLSEQEAWRLNTVTIQPFKTHDVVVVTWIPSHQNDDTWSKRIVSELHLQHPRHLAAAVVPEPPAEVPVPGLQGVSSHLTKIPMLVDFISVKGERLIPFDGSTGSLRLRYEERYKSLFEYLHQRDVPNTYWQARFNQVEI